jgi:hypothetical protein
MKYSWIAIILFSVSNNIIAQSKAIIGMTQNEVKKIYPDVETSSYQNTITLSRHETIYGLDGGWGYQFEEGKLNWIYYNKYIDEITDTNFKLCLAATKQIIKDYTKLYGNPDTTITGKEKFIDPYTKPHWGYNVLEARWKDSKGMKINVRFTFLGGKGQYHFLVKINYFDKTYPYLD